MSEAPTETKVTYLDEVIRSHTTAALISEVKRRIKADEFEDGDLDALVEALDPEPIEDAEALDEAAARWRRGECKAALHYLENALGSDFWGLGDLTPEQLK